MPHICCVVEALARGAAPIHYPSFKCEAQYPRRDALEAEVQADLGLAIGPHRCEGEGGKRCGFAQPAALVRIGLEQPGQRTTT